MKIETGDLHIYSEMSIERILSAAEALGVGAVIVDSIQTTYSEKLDMPPGSIGQVREVASQFLFWTKKRNVPVFLIGHITKEGALAGPKALEHIVDTVLYFEGPRQHPHRIVRTIKNRFGAANELGIFEMSPNGLRPVDNPSGLFLSGTGKMDAGSAVVCSVEGSAPASHRAPGPGFTDPFWDTSQAHDRGGSTTARSDCGCNREAARHEPVGTGHLFECRWWTPGRRACRRPGHSRVDHFQFAESPAAGLDGGLRRSGSGR